MPARRDQIQLVLIFILENFVTKRINKSLLKNWFKNQNPPAVRLIIWRIPNSQSRISTFSGWSSLSDRIQNWESMRQCVEQLTFFLINYLDLFETMSKVFSSLSSEFLMTKNFFIPCILQVTFGKISRMILCKNKLNLNACLQVWSLDGGWEILDMD